MPRKPKTTEAAILAHARQSVRDGTAAPFDVEQVLISIASDKKCAPTTRINACRLLVELAEAEENRRSAAAAGL